MCAGLLIKASEDEFDWLNFGEQNGDLGTTASSTMCPQYTLQNTQTLTNTGTHTSLRGQKKKQNVYRKQSENSLFPDTQTVQEIVAAFSYFSNHV